MVEFQIRRATGGDIEALMSLRVALLREAGNLVDDTQTSQISEALRHYFEAKLASKRRGGSGCVPPRTVSRSTARRDSNRMGSIWSTPV
jgi:hypothetical protein